MVHYPSWLRGGSDQQHVVAGDDFLPFATASPIGTAARTARFIR